MDPAVLALMIPLAAIGLGWWATYLKHKEKMAGVGRYGQGDANLRQTVQLLTETLERQHDRQQALVKRLEALEAIVTHERLPEPHGPLSIPDAPALEPAEVSTRTAGRTPA